MVTQCILVNGAASKLDYSCNLSFLVQGMILGFVQPAQSTNKQQAGKQAGRLACIPHLLTPHAC